MTSLSALAFNATLKPSSGEPSSTDRMIQLLAAKFSAQGIKLSETVRLADHDIKPGVTSDEGAGDAWPAIREKVVAADILIFGTPIWMGQVSSVAKRAMERLGAFTSETDDQGRMPSYGKLCVFAIVGNEDGAHNCTAQLAQSLNDSGFTVPPVAACYWVGEAMGSTDFKELDQVPDMIDQTAGMVADNAAHLAKLLKDTPFPGHE
ncbi:NADPH-dependent oxidoreductase [Pacificimonas flava]|uniref:NADPH-dependent oxidoreductase n=2 Tax=Pacificimonas TaxID=1960290 RepID=A0A219B5R8_9SPHN|nr:MULTISPECIES: NAD(P)H-dependent oxidoreductase [Pacificimonas]MBZ6379299.1 NAD(P)H-dependent oxidoreductase [Pacificimonas aurantium]OWV33493.1 NADPH-dependent oxidoreductase [Pacificimonas flava]